MSSGSNRPTQTTTTVNNNEPPAWAKGGLTTLGNDITSAYKAGDFKPQAPDFSTVVPYSEQTQQAMSGMADVAAQGNPNAILANQGLEGILQGGGLTGQQQGMIGNLSRSADGSYRPEAAMGVAQNMNTAAGNNLMGNPFIDQMISDNATTMGTAITDQMGTMGRGGSGVHQKTLSDSIGQMATGLRADNYNRERANQMSASNALISGAQAQDSLANNAAGSAFNAMQTGNQNVFTGGQLSPALYSAQMAPYDTMMQIGSMEEDLAAREMDEQLANFNTENNARMAELNNFGGLLQGVVNNYGTSTAQVQAPNPNYRSPLEMGMGYGLTAAGLFGGF
jgi:hypothetical protein